MAEDVNAELAERLQQAVAAVLRWASRPAVRDRLWPGDLSFVPTPTDVWLLDLLADEGAARMTVLARRQGVDKSTITLQVKRLMAAGLVQRSPDPSDGRASLVGVTDAGERVRIRVRRAGSDLLAEQLTDWSAEDRAAFVELLGRFAADLSVAGAAEWSSARDDR